MEQGQDWSTDSRGRRADGREREWRGTGVSVLRRDEGELNENGRGSAIACDVQE